MQDLRKQMRISQEIPISSKKTFDNTNGYESYRACRENDPKAIQTDSTSLNNKSVTC